MKWDEPRESLNTPPGSSGPFDSTRTSEGEVCAGQVDLIGDGARHVSRSYTALDLSTCGEKKRYSGPRAAHVAWAMIEQKSVRLCTAPQREEMNWHQGDAGRSDHDTPKSSAFSHAHVTAQTTRVWLSDNEGLTDG